MHSRTADIEADQATFNGPGSNGRYSWEDVAPLLEEIERLKNVNALLNHKLRSVAGHLIR